MPIAARLARVVCLVLSLAMVSGGCIPQERSPSEVPGLAFPPGSGTLSYGGDFPDPFILREGGTYYAYATNGGVLGCSSFQKVRALRSADLRNWTPICNVLPREGSWASSAPEAGAFTWAPSVLRVAANSYVLYYTARRTQTGQQCIGRAVSSSPEGPFVDERTSPLACEGNVNWSIDASPFRDADGSLHLVWRRDTPDSTIVSRELTPDGRGFKAGSTIRTLLSEVGGPAWEGGLIEGPSLHRRPCGGSLYLYYSANRWDSADYRTGWALCASPAGPCNRVGILLGSNGERVGPGGQEFFTSASNQQMVTYHGWPPGAVNTSRRMHVAKLGYTDGTVAMAATPSGAGYWVVGPTGAQHQFGNAPDLDDLCGLSLAKPIVGVAAHPSGGGTWMVASDGGVFAFGSAQFHGSAGGLALQKPIVGMAVTPSGNGYWLVAADGGIFAYGDAGFHGSTGGLTLNAPIVGMARTPSGNGYWLVASDGGIFAFGDAGFHGSTGGLTLNAPIVGMARTPSGNGYWLVAADGGIFAFGDAAFHGSTGSLTLNAPIVGMAATPSGGGYWLVAKDGGLFAFGNAGFYGRP